MRAPDASRSRWSLVREMLTRPYPTSSRVVVPFVVLALIVPGYLVIGAYMRGRTLHMPELALDRAVPVQPIWAVVYGSLYFCMFLPLVVVRREEQIRRTLLAFIMLWMVAYVWFLSYPTVLLRPAKTAIGEGFFAWTLRIVDTWDGPYNCFPSLHVAQSYLAALTCYCVHRGIGIAALVWASLISLSTLFTKQHYVADVIAGTVMGYAAYVIFLRSYPRAAAPEIDRRVAPVVVLGFIGIHALVVFGFWVAYKMGVRP